MKKLIFIIPFIILSCNKKEITSVVINNDGSSEIDLFNGEYIVYYMDKEDTKINFTVKEAEILQVKKSYVSENIGKYGEEILVVDDAPIMMPAYDTQYIITFEDGSKQTIIIRTDFRKNPIDAEKYKNLKVFIEKIDKMISSKKEIQEAPKSNVFSI